MMRPGPGGVLSPIEQFKSINNNKSIFYVKMKEIKNKELQERQAYVPASVEVIEFTAQKVLCGSGNDLTTYPGNNWD